MLIGMNEPLRSAANITTVAHIGIRVHDLARARAFYEGVLGFEFIIGPIGPEPVAILEHPNGVEINLILNAPAADAPNVLMDIPDKHAGITHVALCVRSLDAMIEQLGAAGISLSGGPVHYPNGSRGAFVRDPDRNVIEFYEPAAEPKPWT